MINEAMIFAAGLGKRMQHLTKRKPKPLLKIKKKSILKNNIEKLIQNNFKNIVINTFYHPEQIIRETEEFPSVKVIIEKERLETGGGVLNAVNKKYFENESPILLLNGDIFWLNEDYDSIEKIKTYWNPKKMDMLLCLKKKEEFFGYDGSGDFELTESEEILSPLFRPQKALLAFTGLQITKQNIFREIKKKRFSIRDQIMVSLKKRKLFGYVDQNPWFHIGSLEAYKKIREIYNE